MQVGIQGKSLPNLAYNILQRTCIECGGTGNPEAVYSNLIPATFLGKSLNTSELYYSHL